MSRNKENDITKDKDNFANTCNNYNVGLTIVTNKKIVWNHELVLQ